MGAERARRVTGVLSEWLAILDDMAQRKPYATKRRPNRQSAIVVRMSREERDALHRLAGRRGTNVTAYVLSKIERDLRQELGSASA